MAGKQIDISGALSWDEGIPAPQWDLLTNWVESQVDEGESYEAWTDIARQWLEQVGEALGDSFRLVESENVLLLSTDSKLSPESMLRFVEQCRAAVVAILRGVAAFPGPGKGVVVVMPDSDRYYAYLSRYTPEGKMGSSIGVQVREGYAHIVLNAHEGPEAGATLAHETMHAALAHLTLPLWIEEGLAQMFEHDMAPRGVITVNQEMADEHKKYWKKHTLDDFWRGEGFLKAGRAQKLSYQLAEILMRLLIEEHRPRWFGFVKEQQRRFFQFLRFADRVDCGAEAAQSHLGMTLTEIAGKFLGPGAWEPSL
jgi:hypothetical protein